MFEKLKQVILMIWGGVITLQVYFGDAFWFVEDNQGGGSFFFSRIGFLSVEMNSQLSSPPSGLFLVSS